ncbi:MAG: hypothetical protein SFU25_04785, partial [Candidatus Caenarcaniphilales bacterium]|nr:hypothetical protein [Candidatus Caenarcaniphilales bacterium]
QCLKNQAEKNTARFIAYPFGSFNRRVEQYASRHFAAGFAYNNRLYVPSLRGNNKFQISRIIISSNKSVDELISVVNNKTIN